jgi:hypothetical protein
MRDGVHLRVDMLFIGRDPPSDVSLPLIPVPA